MTDSDATLDERLELAWDVSIVPASEVSPDVRLRLAMADTDYAVSAFQDRASTQLVNRDVVVLLEQFRTPALVREAVERYTARTGETGEAVAVAVVDLVRDWKHRGVLRSPDGAPDEIASAGTTIGPYAVLQVLRRSRHCEVLRVSSRVHGVHVLKLARPGRPGVVDALFAREAAALGQLQGRSAPRLLEHGTYDGRHLLCLEWRDGAHASLAAQGVRDGGVSGLSGLLHLSLRMLDAYLTVHAAGVIHGDVQPLNVLAGPAGAITVVDFALARLEPKAGDPDGWRGGVLQYFEPEYASAILDGRPAPPATRLGEQYSLAALVYELISGHRYLPFAWDRAAALAQIVCDRPRRFDTVGARPWPQAEDVLDRALAKEPKDRFASLLELRDALAACAVPRRSRAKPPAGDPIAPFLDRVTFAGPRASVAYGAAGISYLCYRAAIATDRADLLAAAQRWTGMASRWVSAPDGLTSADSGITALIATPRSLYYGAAGVHCVSALVHLAAGDFRALDGAIAAYCHDIDRADGRVDLTSGAASALLGCAILAGAALPAGACDLSSLVERGERLYREIHAWIQRDVAVSSDPSMPAAGLAHGWPGVLHAALQWLRVVDVTPPPAIRERLKELESIQELDAMAGWCRGCAGHVSLWTAAYRAFGLAEFRIRAIEAARCAGDRRLDHIPHLCCGLAGQAEALFEVYRLTGEETWLDRGRRFVDTIGSDGLVAGSLLRGEVGVALARLDAANPDYSGMPLLEAGRL